METFYSGKICLMAYYEKLVLNKLKNWRRVKGFITQNKWDTNES